MIIFIIYNYRTLKKAANPHISDTGTSECLLFLLDKSIEYLKFMPHCVYSTSFRNKQITPPKAPRPQIWVEPSLQVALTAF